MTTKSPLRRLAREYYEGHIDRADYKAQRKRLLSELVKSSAAAAIPPASGEITRQSVFDSLGEEQPDSTDLANALASRGDDVPPGVTPPENDLIPDLSAPPSEDAVTEAPVVPAREGRGTDSRKPGIWLRVLVLLSLLLCTGAAAVLFYLQR